MRLVEVRLKTIKKLVVLWLFSAERGGGNPLPKDLLNDKSCAVLGATRKARGREIIY